MTNPTSSPPSPRRRRRRVVLTVLGAVAAVSVVNAAVPYAVDDGSRAPASSAVQARLDGLTERGFPGVLAEVADRDGRSRSYVAGVARLGGDAPPPVDGRVRIGSNTKPFTATVVLQLVGEGRVALDAPVDEYLPGLLRGDGIDGRRITVRQLLQHTSGLPDYDAILIRDFFRTAQHRYVEPHELVDAALTQPARFAPGKGWSYSNTNYVVAGLLVQHVTGRPIGEEITKRVIRPLGLEDTSFPPAGEQRIRGPHPHGYWVGPDGGTRLRDVTTTDPSFGWAAGQMISSPSDLARFFRALLDGRLLKPAQLAEMQRTVAAPGASVRGGARYGLGLQTVPLSCGGTAWTHGGDIQGFETRQAFADDGRSAVVAVTALPRDEQSAVAVEEAVDFAVCRGR